MANDIRTIPLRGEYQYHDEYLASAAIKPGMLVEIVSAGTMRAHASAGAKCAPWFAFEDSLQGDDIDDDYASGDRVRSGIFTTAGAEVYALLANGETAVIGTQLVSNGDGYLKAYTADSSAVIVEEHIIGMAKEAVDMSGSSGVDPDGRIKVVLL